MSYLANKYSNKGLSLIGVFSYDIESGEKKSNKEIAHKLNQMGFIDDKGHFLVAGIKFLEKVSTLYFTFM